MASRRRQPRGPQGERTRARAFDRLATSNRARRRDEKITDCHCSVTYLVAGPRGRIVIKPTRQASPIGRVYRRPSRSWWVVVSGAPCREPGGPRRGASLFALVSSCNFFSALAICRKRSGSRPARQDLGGDFIPLSFCHRKILDSTRQSAHPVAGFLHVEFYSKSTF